MAVALYARVSTTRQAENDLSIPDQLKQLRAWCEKEGHAIAAEFVEPGATATDDRRPEFQRMIADVTRTPGRVDMVLVHSRSRFSRDLLQCLHYERQLQRAGVKLVSITQQTADDPGGEMASKMFSLFDEYQSQENSKHTKRAMQENARQGYWNGSTPPFGYRAVETSAVGNRGRKKKRLEVDAAEGQIVTRIYALYLSGTEGIPMGTKAIASYLNAQSISMRGRPWRIQKVQEVLADTCYMGCFYFNRTDSRTKKPNPRSEWIAVEVPAIVSESVYERVAQRRAHCNPKMHAPRALSSPAPLVGLLKCGHCGSNMLQATGKTGRYRYYKCATRLAKKVDACDSRNLPRDTIDERVLGVLAEKVFTPLRVKRMLEELIRRQRAASSVEDAQLLSLRKDLDEVTRGQQRLYEAVEKELLPMDETLRDRAHKLKARREDILIEIAKLQDRKQMAIQKVTQAQIDAFCDTLQARMRDPSTGFGKAYLHLLVDEIRLDGDQLKMRGSYGKLADAIGSLEKKKLGLVPSFVPTWRARDDSNVRPLP